MQFGFLKCDTERRTCIGVKVTLLEKDENTAVAHLQKLKLKLISISMHKFSFACRVNGVGTGSERADSYCTFGRSSPPSLRGFAFSISSRIGKG